MRRKRIIDFTNFIPYFQLYNFTLADINECLTDNGGCSQDCVNVEGSYRCECRITCKAAYTLQGDQCHRKSHDCKIMYQNSTHKKLLY